MQTSKEIQRGDNDAVNNILWYMHIQTTEAFLGPHIFLLFFCMSAVNVMACTKVYTKLQVSVEVLK